MSLHPKLKKIDLAPELAGFKTQPAQMRAAAHGKVGELKLVFSLRDDGLSILSDLYRVTPLLVQKALYWDENMPNLPICKIISVGGGILQGDRYFIDIKVEAGACAHVGSQGANRIQQMDANYASQYQVIEVESNGYLEYLPDFTIPYRNSRYINHSKLIVAPSATALYGEMIISGRKHHHPDERFGFDLLSMSFEVVRPDGTEIFAEKQLVTAQEKTINLPAVMQGFDCFANILCITPADTAQRIQERFQGVFDQQKSPRVISGVSKLPNGAGLILRVVGVESYDVRAEVRKFWKIVREEAKNRTLSDELIWLQ